MKLTTIDLYYSILQRKEIPSALRTLTKPHERQRSNTHRLLLLLFLSVNTFRVDARSNNEPN